MKVRNLTVKGSTGVVRVDDLSFDLKGGEIFGIAGVEGNGQGHLVEAITGLTKKYNGEILVFDEDIKKTQHKRNKR